MEIQFRTDCKYAIFDELSQLRVLSYNDFVKWIPNILFNLNCPLTVRDGEIIFKGMHVNGKIIWVYPIAPNKFDNNYIVFYRSSEDTVSFIYADNELDIPSDESVLVARI